MATLFSRVNPVPGFPEHTGPYSVGTVDVEMPIANLPCPSVPPDSSISTVQFRIFYPCDPASSKEKPARWVPQPQREYIGAYARFMGAGHAFAEIFSYFPGLFYHITIPAKQNASLRKASTKTGRWPVMVFSHGLGGSRNAYSHLLGSVASHGLVVVAAEHRDGSAPITYIRATAPNDSHPLDSEKVNVGVSSNGRPVQYKALPHNPSHEVEGARNEQLRIRLWELGLIHEALLALDQGEDRTHLDAHVSSSLRQPPHGILQMFRHQLEIHEPGTISWAGHSFGAATTVQFIKSVFYSPSVANHSDDHFPNYSALYVPSPSSNLVHQITPSTPVVLLDLWTLPLRGESTRWLWSRPMPCYAPSGPGGRRLLAILSEAFFQWSANLRDTKAVLHQHPTSMSQKTALPGPRIFYPVSSAHLSQSDFGILFPWFTRKVFNANHPERAVRLNARAILQLLRDNAIEVAPTSRQDMEKPGEGKDIIHVSDKEGLGDWEILAANPNGTVVDGWIAVSTDIADGPSTGMDIAKPPSEAVLDHEVLEQKS